MSLTTSLIQIRTSLIPAPGPGETDYSECAPSFTIKYDEGGVEKEKSVRRPYPRFAVRTLETKRLDQVIEFDRFWVLERELGVGSFGAVYRVRVLSTRKCYAIKILRKNDFSTTRNVSQLLREIGILGSVSHPNIVKLYELLETRDLFIMVLEDCRGGELLARLTALPDFPETTAKTVMRAIFSALVYLHDRHIVHRDLKLENILLADDPEAGDEDWSKLRIADFGLANFCDTGRTDVLQTRCGTFHYMPPEIIRGRTYGPAVDMWSCGVILFILLSGCYPFDAEDAASIMSNIKRGKYEFPEPEWVSKEALELMAKLMVVDPEKRLKPAEALQHPWFFESPGSYPSPMPHDQARWLSNIRKNHVVRNYIRKIVTQEPDAADATPETSSPVVSDIAATWPAALDLHKEMAGVPTSTQPVSTSSIASLSTTSSGSTRMEVPHTPSPSIIHRRRASSASSNGAPALPSPVITVPAHPSYPLSPNVETPTPHLPDDKPWFHLGLPALLNDMGAVFSAQLAGQEHAGLELLRSSRGKSTDDYFRKSTGLGIGIGPSLPGDVDRKELRDRYRRESAILDAGKTSTSKEGHVLGSNHMSMDPVSEGEESEGATPVAGNEAVVSMDGVSGKLARMELEREMSSGAGSDVTAVPST